MADSMQLSVLASYDDLHRCASMLASASTEGAWLSFSDYVQTLIQGRDEATAECRRLQDEVSKCHEKAASSDNQLALARKLVDQERKLRRSAEAARDAMERQLNLVRDILLSDNRNKLHDDTKEKLAFLNSRRSGGQARYSDARLDTITELDATGMLLGNLSYSRSEDSMDTSFHPCEPLRKHVSLAPDDCISPKRRRSSHRRSMEQAKRIEMSSSDRLVATTTVTVDHTGNTKASSKIETGSTDDQSPMRKKYLPSAPPISDSTSDSSEKLAPTQSCKTPLGPFNDGSPGFGMGRRTLVNRQHEFIRRVCIRPDVCIYCKKQLGFAKLSSKCRNCCAICHDYCESLLPLPCVPVGNTQAVRGTKGTIADYTPMSSPMVPALVVHCIQEVESRGLGEIGIYRVPGSERDVKALKEKFLRGKGVPNLSKEDIHVICGTLKDFLRSLKEPLILRTYWHDFIQATDISDPDDARAAVIQAVSELPQPNRDTLAALILHLQHVAECPECKMPTSNLAKIFGPTIVGYSSTDLEPQKMYFETVKQSEVVELLLRLPSDYWANFAMPCAEQENMLRTPSSASVNCGARTIGTTPRSVRGKKKFFPTPPMFR